VVVSALGAAVVLVVVWVVVVVVVDDGVVDAGVVVGGDGVVEVGAVVVVDPEGGDEVTGELEEVVVVEVPLDADDDVVVSSEVDGPVSDEVVS
jgi:hypothetical protein